MSEPTRFYLVYALGTSTLPYEVEERADAYKKAQEVALACPGTTIIVFEPVEAFRTAAPSVQKVWLAFPVRGDVAELPPLQRPGIEAKQEAA